MLYFSKLKITLIVLFTLFMVAVSSSNFLNLDLDKQKKIKLGLDLQGGSYLLLEADINSVVNERLETVNDDVSRKLKEYDVIPIKKVNSAIKVIFSFEKYNT